MRLNIVHPGAGELKYEIRSIVTFAKKLGEVGLEITWENIGDPIAKGEQVPEWIRQIVADEASKDNISYAYSPTKGLDEARNYLAQTRSEETNSKLDPDNIIFFNGLGDAITKVYTWLNPIARVLGPNPAYPTHSSIEGAHGRSQHLTYTLDPLNNWLPDIADVRNKVEYNPNIAALLIINPDNPTGTVYPKALLKEFVAIAKEYNLFLIADEIYANLAFEPDKFTSLAEIADGIPIIIMRGLSKEVPWPGSRCGWLEYYNTDKDRDFFTYVQSIEEAKMNEVCSTTLPQTVLPKILGDKRYQPHLETRRQKYQKRARQAAEVFNNSSSFSVVEPKGAFYLSVTFKNSAPRCTPSNEAAASLLKEELNKDPNIADDKRFCLELLATTGICTVPLSSGFNSHVQGFRVTLLEEDDAKFEKTLQTIVNLAD